MITGYNLRSTLLATALSWFVVAAIAAIVLFSVNKCCSEADLSNQQKPETKTVHITFEFSDTTLNDSIAIVSMDSIPANSAWIKVIADDRGAK